MKPSKFLRRRQHEVGAGVPLLLLCLAAAVGFAGACGGKLGVLPEGAAGDASTDNGASAGERSDPRGEAGRPNLGAGGSTAGAPMMVPDGFGGRDGFGGPDGVAGDAAPGGRTGFGGPDGVAGDAAPGGRIGFGGPDGAAGDGVPGGRTGYGGRGSRSGRGGPNGP